MRPNRGKSCEILFPLENRKIFPEVGDSRAKPYLEGKNRMAVELVIGYYMFGLLGCVDIIYRLDSTDQVVAFGEDT